MGLLNWLFGNDPPPEPGQPGPQVLSGPGTFRVPVVGEASYQGALDAICGGRTEESVDSVDFPLCSS